MRTADRFVGGLMMLIGAAIVLVFGGGAVAVLVNQFALVIQGRPQVGGLMEALLVAPIVGGAPALLGLVLARMGWRRVRPPPPGSLSGEPADRGDAP
jgi:hypothetical protein